MDTYEERVRLIFRFIEDDLEGLFAHRPGTFQDLQKDLATFAGVSPRELTLDVLVELRATLIHKIVWPIAAHNFRESKGGAREGQAEYHFPSHEPDTSVEWVYRDGHLTPSLPATIRRATIDVSSPATRFLWEVCVALSQVDASRVRICHREECGRYFFAEHGNQFYCTQQCGNKARIKRYRQASVLTDPETGKTHLRIKAESPAEKESIRHGMWLLADRKKAKTATQKKEE